jgi:hypothetical protein
MENHHYYYKWPFSIAMLVYQRVTFMMLVGDSQLLNESVHPSGFHGMILLLATILA